MTGYMFALLSTVTSGVAAVYTEFVMKARDDALYWQNVQLYSYGAVFNFATLTIGSMHSGGGAQRRAGLRFRVVRRFACCRVPLCVLSSTWNHGASLPGILSRGADRLAGFWLFSVFKGYTATTWLVACNLAFSGLLVSWIMKFADSILKVFATSMSMLLTMLVSVAFFDTQLSLQVRNCRAL